MSGEPPLAYIGGLCGFSLLVTRGLYLFQIMFFRLLVAVLGTIAEFVSLPLGEVWLTVMLRITVTDEAFPIQKWLASSTASDVKKQSASDAEG